METPKTIRSILAKGESTHVEFKSAAASLEALGQTICAFLNSGGGQIVIGVRDDGQIEGEVSSKKIEALLQPLSGGTSPGGLITPNAVWDVSEERLDRGAVAIIDVPSGGDLPYVFQDDIFIRVGSQTRQANGSQTRYLIEKRYLLGARWERQPVNEVTLADLNADEISMRSNRLYAKHEEDFRRLVAHLLQHIGCCCNA